MTQLRNKVLEAKHRPPQEIDQSAVTEHLVRIEGFGWAIEWLAFSVPEKFGYYACPVYKNKLIKDVSERANYGFNEVKEYVGPCGYILADDSTRVVARLVCKRPKWDLI